MKTTTIILIILLILLGIWLGSGFIVLQIACRRRWEIDLRQPQQVKGKQMEQYHSKILAGMDWLEQQQTKQLYLTSRDGLRLAARLLEQPQPELARGTIVLMHGYRSKACNDFSCSLPLYYSLGYNLLIADQRAHGRSEGKYICFGILERYDCCDWAQLMAQRYGAQHPLVLGGLSMGATTVLMASGLPLPDSVCCIIADCGFTSPWDIVKKETCSRYHIPAWLLKTQLDFMARLLAGFSFQAYSTLDAMQVNTRPILFIHGTADDFVPSWMTVAAYEACRAEKELLLVEKAEHGMSFLLEEEHYTKTLSEFLQQHSCCR